MAGISRLTEHLHAAAHAAPLGCARSRGRGRGSPGGIYVLTFFAAFLTFLPLCLTSALPCSALPSASSRFLPVTFPAASLTFPLAFSPVCLGFLSPSCDRSGAGSG